MFNQKNAQDLLKWGLENTPVNANGTTSTAEIVADIAAGKRPDLADPSLYNTMMGKSEAQMMREELAVAVDPSRSIQDRCTALDNFEMLIEQLDNANNMSGMNMWPPLIQLLSASEYEIQVAAAWIVGTAVQNNDKAQVAILSHQPLSPLLDLLGSNDFQVRSKAMYAISGLLKHNPAAVAQFEQMDGWSKLKTALVDPNISLRRKTAFLINTLLFQDVSVVDESGSTASASSTATLPSSQPRSSLQTNRVAPMPHSSAPLERGPETLLTGIKHPDISKAVYQSGLLRTLISSLLPHGTPGIDDDHLPPATGPDGDTEPRYDLDYSEKAARSIVSFISKLETPETGRLAITLDDSTIRLFKALSNQLEASPLEEESTCQTRWQELSIDNDDWSQFHAKVQSWAT